MTCGELHTASSHSMLPRPSFPVFACNLGFVQQLGPVSSKHHSITPIHWIIGRNGWVINMSTSLGGLNQLCLRAIGPLW
jgi:hypothetical protein